MTKHLDDLSLRKSAIIAGISILIMTIAAVVATDLTIGSLIVEGDAAATFNKIKASDMLFRIGILSWLIILICDVLAAWGLYVFLKPVNNSIALIMAWFRLVYTAILGTALLNYVKVALLISGVSYTTSLGIDQLQSHTMISLIAFQDIWSIGLVVFGFHIYFLGYLIIKSNYIPKIFGILLIIAFLGYLITNLTDLLLPGYGHITTIIGWIFIIPMLAEVGLGLWLLIKGVKVQQVQ